MTPTFTTGADLLGAWFADVERGEPPTRYTLPAPFAALDVRPGRLILFGGAPGGGKTAALVQIGIDLLRLNEAARLLAANVEMIPTLLVERVASRLSGVPLTAITDRTLTPDQLGRVSMRPGEFALHANELGPLGVAALLQEVGVHQPRQVVVVRPVDNGRQEVGSVGHDLRVNIIACVVTI